jgi:hypothetical protein
MDKVDKLIQTVRLLKEEGAIANVVGTGGLTGSATPPGRMDGYDKVMGLVRRRKAPQIIGKGKFPGARKRWSKKKRKS